ncbi:MAG: aldehyde dehydrogenase family protein [Phycisphaeraceae bacterium]|nr:aldehyde dehydrogenase family protein [Phycisphaeraceae bacterium]
MHAPSDLIGGEWVALNSGGRGAAKLESHNPARPLEIVWSGGTRLAHVESAVAAARRAAPAWAAWGRDSRFNVLRRFADLCKANAAKMAELICDETGKAMWEAKGEAAALASKVDITLDASPIGGLRRVEGYEVEVGPQRIGRCWFRPHGVMAVIGPFNFPAHLPNGHIIPALAMGNTLVFKPSDKAPGVGQLLVELLAEALAKENAPDKGRGVVNLVQGGAEIASALTTHDGIDGILFTGSWPVGRRIMEANLDRPGRLVALEMGGNNAAVVMDDADLRQAAIEVVRCAFNTTGQRCTCTRRVIVHESIADNFLRAVCTCASKLAIGDPRARQPVFMGPIIRREARDAVLDFQTRAKKAGAQVVLEAAPVSPRGSADGWYISPGVMLVDRFTSAPGATRGFDPGCDDEIFGPLLRMTTVDSLDEAIEQCNATRFGLAASIFTRSQETAQRFMAGIRCGCININNGTAGASSKLPFGGLGLSGNHRPAASFSLDYCAYPVAGMIERGPSAALADGMTFDDSWLD